MSTKYKDHRDVPTETYCNRLQELATVFSVERDRIAAETTMRVPAELDRDADLVMSGSAIRMKELLERIAELEAALAECCATNSDEVKRRHWAELLDAIGANCHSLAVDFYGLLTWDDTWHGQGESENHGAGTDYESLYRYLGLADKEAG